MIIINRNIIFWLACIIASRFRQSLSSAAYGSSENTNSSLQIAAAEITNYSLLQNDKLLNKMSTKDLQVVKSVALICIIFILSQLPFQIISTIQLFNPEIANLRKKSLVDGVAIHISNTFGYLHRSVNIFVHYHFNARLSSTGPCSH